MTRPSEKRGSRTLGLGGDPKPDPTSPALFPCLILTRVCADIQAFALLNFLISSNKATT